MIRIGVILLALLAWACSGPTSANSSSSKSSSSVREGDTINKSSSSTVTPNALYHNSMALGSWSLNYNYFSSQNFQSYAMNDTSARKSKIDLAYKEGVVSNFLPDSLGKTQLCDLGTSTVYATVSNDQILLDLWNRNKSNATSQVTLKTGNCYLARNSLGTVLIFKVTDFNKDSNEVLLVGSYYPYLDTTAKGTSTTDTTQK